MTRAQAHPGGPSTALALALALTLGAASAPRTAASPPRPLRQHTSIIEYLDVQAITPRLPRLPPLECLAKAVHPPWQNPFSPLPPPLAQRHQRLTVSPGPAAVEFGDALLVEPGHRLTFSLVARTEPRLELSTRIYRCAGTNKRYALRITTRDAMGQWSDTVSLANTPPPGGEIRDSAFADLSIALPVMPSSPFALDLEVLALDDARPGERQRPPRPSTNAASALVALVDPRLSGLDPEPTTADTNVLWIVIDAVRQDAMGPGRTFSPSASPELDRRVFARGTAFSHAYALANQTRTSTVAMLASVPASVGGFHSHGWAFTSGKRETFYQRDPPLLPRLLERAGFLTRHIGHNHFLWSSEIIGVDHGFSRAFDVRAIPQDAIEASRAAIRFFTRHRDSRWMLMLNYTAPHTPYRPPEAFLERARALTDPPSSDKIGFLPRTYLGEILWVDYNLESVFAALERLDLLEDTLIIVTADHGEVMNPAHDCASALLEQPCGFNHGVTVYDDELRVPLAMALPGRISPGLVVDTRISHADLAPTILDLLGLPKAPGQVGRTLVPALEGRPIEPLPIYADGRLAAAYVEGEKKLIVHADKDDIEPRPRMSQGTPARFEVFDLARDPLELDNLAADETLLRTLQAGLSGTRERLRLAFARQSRDAGATVGSPMIATTTAYHLQLVAGESTSTLGVRVSAPGALSCVSPPPSCTAPSDMAVRLTLDAPVRGVATATFLADSRRPPDLDLTLDGVPLPTDRLRLGPWGLAMLMPGAPWPPPDPTWLDALLPPTPQPHERAIYLWRNPAEYAATTPSLPPGDGVGTPEGEKPDFGGDAKLGGEVKRILKDLGYTH